MVIDFGVYLLITVALHIPEKEGKRETFSLCYDHIAGCKSGLELFGLKGKTGSLTYEFERGG